MIFNDKNEIKEVKNELIEKEKYELFNTIEAKRAQLRMKKNIIIKISNKIINTEINLIDENYDDLNISHFLLIILYQIIVNRNFIFKKNSI